MSWPGEARTPYVADYRLIPTAPAAKVQRFTCSSGAAATPTRRPSTSRARSTMRPPRRRHAVGVTLTLTTCGSGLLGRRPDTHRVSAGSRNPVEALPTTTTRRRRPRRPRPTTTTSISDDRTHADDSERDSGAVLLLILVVAIVLVARRARARQLRRRRPALHAGRSTPAPKRCRPPRAASTTRSPGCGLNQTLCATNVAGGGPVGLNGDQPAPTGPCPAR